jgi:hypothetical protein
MNYIPMLAIYSSDFIAASDMATHLPRKANERLRTRVNAEMRWLTVILSTAAE